MASRMGHGALVIASAIRPASIARSGLARHFSSQPEFVGHYINGQMTKRPEGANATFDNINPCTGKVHSHIAVGTQNDVDSAVKAAKQAFPAWAAMTGMERGRILHKAAEILRERAPEIARLESIDQGKTYAESISGDMPSGYECVEYYAGVGASLNGEHIDTGGGSWAYTRREPLGVVGGIGAWNYPFQIVCWKSAPALACGNTMVFKPSELTPLTAMKVAEAYTDAGVPPGVFNVVHGQRTTGEAMVAHPGIHKITFTGANTTGKSIMRASADTLKHITFELGGKSPLLIFDDCHIKNAVEGALKANFYSQGEVCSNGTRVYVQEGVYDDFMKRLVARTKDIVVGDPFDEKTLMGPLISEAHLGKVLSYVELGKAEGARLAFGGERLHDRPGWFMNPAIFEGVTDDMRIAREEIFGPVICVMKFKTEEEAVRRANDSVFGLAAGLFTKDITRAHRIAAQFEAGTIYINNFNVAPVQTPFGGYKTSGIGRENGRGAVEHFTQLKTVHVEMNDIEFP